MADLPEQLAHETTEDYALFLEYLSPQNGINPIRTIPPQHRAIAQQNHWISRALDWDIAQLKAHHTPKPSPSEVVANALIKLAGSTLAGNSRTDEQTITKAVKLIDGFRKLK
ncbi:MAG: hypothetical protein IJU23_10995 [Proteobacteria bacterium]|nr:hypothetical protein [Pseudomonadota bacterium]